MTQSTSGRVSREKRGQIMLIGLDRASKRNAFDLDLLNDLCLAYGDFERDVEPLVRSICQRGNAWASELRALQPYMVSLNERDFEKSRAAGFVLQITPELWRWHGDYDQLYGLRLQHIDTASFYF